MVSRKEIIEYLHISRLTNSYFRQFPQLGRYVKPQILHEFKEEYDIFFNWLRDSNIDFIPSDRSTLKCAVTATLLGEYEGIVLDLDFKTKTMSKKFYSELQTKKIERAKKAGVSLIFISKEDLLDLDNLQYLLDKAKETKEDK